MFFVSQTNSVNITGDRDMPKQFNVTFQEALEMIEMLPEHQREDIIDIVQRRMVEQKRERLAKNIRKARQEYRRGDITEGTVDDLMKSVSE